MATYGSPSGDIPTLSDEQQQALRTFITRHRDETDGQVSINPILLARVVANDKPAAEIDLKGERDHPNFDDPDGYLRSLCDVLDLEMRKIKGVRSWTVGRSQWRLDLLPTVVRITDAYHRRCGFVYGFPTDAIEEFIETDNDVTNYDLVRAGIFSVEEIAYMSFVAYTRRKSLAGFRQQIELGKQIRRRVGRFADVWEMPILDEYASLVYEDVIKAYRGDSIHSPLTIFPPDQTVTREDVLSMFS